MNLFSCHRLAGPWRYQNDSELRPSHGRQSPISLKKAAVVLASLPVAFALTAGAQTAPPPSAPAGAAEQPALTFRSALDGYQPFTDEKAIPWKEANETVYRRGGWRAYAKEAAESSKDDAPPSGRVDPHAGHSMPMPKKEQP